MDDKKKGKKSKKQTDLFNNPAKSSPDVRKIKEEKKPQRKAQKKEKRMHRYEVLFNIFQGICSFIFVIAFLSLDILPFSYTIICLAVVAALYTLTVLLQRCKRVWRISVRILSIFVMVILLLSSMVMSVMDSALSSITGAPYVQEEQEFNLLSSNLSGSITEDAYCVYVREIGDVEIVKESIYVVNPETRQILCVETPGEIAVTIPGVTQGQKEQIKNAKEYGVEAAMDALSNLYATEIDYYIELDSEWLDEWKVGGISIASLEKMWRELKHADTHICTNMTKDEVRSLIREEIREKKDWRKSSEKLAGVEEKTYTYTSPDDRVEVLMPEEDSLEVLKDTINRVKEGALLQEESYDEDRPTIVIP